MSRYGDRMPDVPPDVAIKATIRPGSVYYFRHESFKHSEDPHYFIVINLDPINEEVILLVSSTTRKYNIKQRYKNFPQQTLVRVTSAQYSGFTYTSIINCNHVYSESLEGLISRLSDKRLLLKPEIDIGLVEQFRRGVLDSPTVIGRIKKQLGTKSA